MDGSRVSAGRGDSPKLFAASRGEEMCGANTAGKMVGEVASFSDMEVVFFKGPVCDSPEEEITRTGLSCIRESRGGWVNDSLGAMVNDSLGATRVRDSRGVMVRDSPDGTVTEFRGGILIESFGRTVALLSSC